MFADVLCGLKGKLLWYWLYFVFGVNYRDDVGSNVTISGDGDASRTSAFFQVPQSTQPDHELQYRMGLVARSGMISSTTTSVAAAHAAAARGFRELANIRESRSSAAAALVGQYEESSNKKTKLEARGAAGHVTSSAMQQAFVGAAGLDLTDRQAGSAAAADDQTFVNPESAEQQVRHASNSSAGTAAAAAPWLQYSAHLQPRHHHQQAYSSSQYPTAYFSQVTTTTTTTRNTITSSSTSSSPSQKIKCLFLGYSFDCNQQVYISKLFLLAAYLQFHLLLQIVTRS